MGFIFGRIRSEEHTSELQSLRHLVCRLLLEKKRQQRPASAARSAPPPQPVPRDRLSSCSSGPPWQCSVSSASWMKFFLFFLMPGHPTKPSLFPHRPLSPP